MSDQFKDWTTLLALAKQHKTKAAYRAAAVAAGITIIESEPLSGYYRGPAVKDGPLLPIAIWREAGTLYVLRAGEPVELSKVWPSCMWEPVSYDAYEAVSERGESWPDQAPLGASVTSVTDVTTLDAAELIEDKPKEPTEHDKVKAGVEVALDTAKLYDKGVTSDDMAGAAQSVRAMLNALATRANNNLKVEKAPIEAELAKVKAKWQGLARDAKAGADALRTKLTAWENEKLAREQNAAEQAAADVPAVDRTVTRSDNEPPIEPVEAPMPTLIKGATGRGAKVTLVNNAVVFDQDAAYAYLKNAAEIVEAIRLVAQRMIDAGHDVPGVRTEKAREVA